MKSVRVLAVVILGIFVCNAGGRRDTNPTSSSSSQTTWVFPTSVATVAKWPRRISTPSRRAAFASRSSTTPRVAARRVRRCSPGFIRHQAGIGHMMRTNGADGYRGDLSRRSVTLAEALKPAGYRTYAVGKWHVTPARRRNY